MGRVDGGVPDRGCGRRGRPRPEHLGHLRPRTRARGDGRDRRRGVRPLPPLPRGRGPDGRARPRRVPVLGGVEPDPARGTRRDEPGRAGVLRPAGRRPAGAWHRPGGDPVPLGPAAGRSGRGRMVQPGHRGLVRRLRRRGGVPARRPGPDVDHPQRTVRAHRVRARLRSACAGAGAHVRRAADRPPPAAGPRPRRLRPSWTYHRTGRDRQQLHPGGPVRRLGRGSGRGRHLRRAAQPPVHRSAVRAGLPGRVRPSGTRRRPGDDRRAASTRSG